jgi:5-methylcytosine-specific restriction endonuclease McrA
MKITWDNLKSGHFTENGNFLKIYTEKCRSTFYIYKCQKCGDIFLGQKGSNYCSKKCSTSLTNLGKKASKKTRDKLSKIRKGKNNVNWKGGVKKNNIPLYDTYATQLEWCEQTRRSPQDKNILEVKCAYCGKWFVPGLITVKNRLGYLNRKKYSGENRFYCSDDCKQECPIYRKQKYPKGLKLSTSREVQPELRQLVFKRDDYTCTKCGSTESLHCHHIEGIRWEPLESADINQCITVCKKCHKEIHKQKDCEYKDLKCENVKKLYRKTFKRQRN